MKLIEKIKELYRAYDKKTVRDAAEAHNKFSEMLKELEGEDDEMEEMLAEVEKRAEAARRSLRRK